LLTDLPVQQHQFFVDRNRRALLRAGDALFQTGEPVAVIAGQRNVGFGHVNVLWM
jgi:hypothetical protein